MKQQRSLTSRASTWVLAITAAASMVACSTYKPPEPSALQTNPASVAVQSGWTAKLASKVDFPLQPAVVGNQVVVAADNGEVQALQADTGAVLWSVNIGSGITAGVGSDGQTSVVADKENRLVAIRNNQVVWRVQMTARAFSAPLVAGGRVFIMTADRGIAAYDAANGYRLWNQKSRAMEEMLVLRQNALLTAAGGALFAGVSGRVVGFNPNNGSPLMQAEVATARGITEVARMADVVGPASRVGSNLCARTYQAGVGCVVLGATSTVNNWSQASRGTTGVTGNEQIVVGSDDAGNVVAWNRLDGKEVWSNTTLRYRGLSAPLLVGSNVVVGDAQGVLHVLSAQTGQLRNRIELDKSGIAVAPVLVGNTAIVVSNSGQVSGVRIQ